ncbi:hypothetical protein FQR65_LT12505 [Abscondita terminalis]|nr:hypothetical protein FQR65_LT12505 [Abscondita terminalis]
MKQLLNLLTPLPRGGPRKLSQEFTLILIPKEKRLQWLKEWTTIQWIGIPVSTERLINLL